MKIIRNLSIQLFVVAFLGILPGSCTKTGPVLAKFTTDLTEIFAGDNIQFINSSENASFYQWDFGDGESSILENPTHVYENPGTYKVTLVSIGDDESNTASREINVIQPFEVTIFEGVGIEGAFIFDSWSDIQSGFTSDTVHVRDYLEDLEAYFHMAYYYTEGVAFVFLNEDTLINNEDSLLFIYLASPYPGGTTKGVGLGSTMDRVETVYGQPEHVAEGLNSESYWYDSQGVDFITYNSELVDEIDIYAISAAKSASSYRSAVKHFFRNRERMIPF